MLAHSRSGVAERFELGFEHVKDEEISYVEM